MNKDINKIIGLIITAISIIVILGCAIASLVIAIKNPDMTEMRHFIEYPEPTIITIIAFITMNIGCKMAK